MMEISLHWKTQLIAKTLHTDWVQILVWEKLPMISLCKMANLSGSTHGDPMRVTEQKLDIKAKHFLGQRLYLLVVLNRRRLMKKPSLPLSGGLKQRIILMTQRNQCL